MKLLMVDNSKIDFGRLSPLIKEKIIKKFDYLKKYPEKISRKMLDEKLSNYLYRVGDFRICFDIDGQNIVINRIRHRREVYK